MDYDNHSIVLLMADGQIHKYRDTTPIREARGTWGELGGN